METALVQNSFGLLAILMVIPATIFLVNSHPKYGKIFKIIPPLVFAYFIPTILTALEIIPSDAIIYRQIKTYVLPASLLLLTLAVDIKGIIRLGNKAIIMFFAGTFGVIIGGPIALFLFKNQLPDEIWKGMAALAGSWIGGGANFIAIGKSVGATDAMLGLMVVVDVLVANIWMGFILYMAGRYKAIDKWLGADNSMVEELKDKVVQFQEETNRVASTTDYMVMLALAFGGAWIAYLLGNALPEIGTIISHTTWKVILITTFGVIFSFTKVRNYEGAGASKLGTVMLYLLIGVIGAAADLKEVIQYPYLFAMGATWIIVHIIIMFSVMKLIKAPLFFMAVGSQANIGGAASAPIVASAFHPALATVGVMLGIAGYVVGTYAALICAAFLQMI